MGFLGSLYLNVLLLLTNSVGAAFGLHEQCCKLAIFGSFGDYAPEFLVCLAFEYYVFACLESSAAWTSDGLLYVVSVVVFSEVILRSSHIQSELVLLSLVCVGEACGMHAIQPKMVACDLHC